VKAQLLPAMPIRPISHVCRILLSLLVFSISFGVSLPAHAQEQANEPTTESIFADAPFEKWKAEGPHQDLPWKVNMSANQLSFHQRLIALIQINFPVQEMLKLTQDDQLILLAEVRNGQGVSARNFGVLELNKLKPEMKRTDIEFSWVAFALPGQYEVALAIWDKKSGKHNFMTKLFHVDAYKRDPLPEMWNGLDVFEFWSDKRDGPEYLFHSDIGGRLNLPLKTKRPLDMELLLDLTPSADIFRGNVGYYNRYLAGAVPMFKIFSQIDVANGSRNAEALDLVQRRVSFSQSGGKELDWASLRRTLSPDNNPGTVSIKDLQNKKQSPVFLREEIVRRLNDPALQGKKDERPLHVFVLIGGPMDMYSFPQVPAIETGNEEDCVIYYFQFNFFERPSPQQQQQRRRRFDRFDRPDRHPERLESPSISGDAGAVEKMLKPLKMRVFQVESPDELRRALAKMMEEMGKL
jgi:hypothetical protein